MFSNMITSKTAITARSMLRRYPRARSSAARFMSLSRPRREYEQSYREAMLARIHPGECIWDVGANVGIYSELFAAATGPSGKVLSFEPAQDCAAILETRRRDRHSHASWEIVPIALSDRDGEGWLSVASGTTAPDNHLASPGDPSVVPVRTARGDSLIAAGLEPPALVKIDVEGFEGEVLDGIGSALDLPSLHTVCVEVHFAVLAERGRPHEPSRIVRMLQNHAFTVKWADASHFVARR